MGRKEGREESGFDRPAPRPSIDPTNPKQAPHTRCLMPYLLAADRLDPRDGGQELDEGQGALRRDLQYSRIRGCAYSQSDLDPKAHPVFSQSPLFCACACVRYLGDGGQGLGVVEHGVGDERVVGVDGGLSLCWKHVCVCGSFCASAGEIKMNERMCAAHCTRHSPPPNIPPNIPPIIPPPILPKPDTTNTANFNANAPGARCRGRRAWRRGRASAPPRGTWRASPRPVLVIDGWVCGCLGGWWWWCGGGRGLGGTGD